MQSERILEEIHKTQEILLQILAELKNGREWEQKESEKATAMMQMTIDQLEAYHKERLDKATSYLAELKHGFPAAFTLPDSSSTPVFVDSAMSGESKTRNALRASQMHAAIAPIERPVTRVPDDQAIVVPPECPASNLCQTMLPPWLRQENKPYVSAAEAAGGWKFGMPN